MRLLKKALLILRTEGLDSLVQRTYASLLGLAYAQYECRTYKALMTAPYRQTVDTTGYQLAHISQGTVDKLVSLGYEDVRLLHPRASHALESGATALAYYHKKKLACFYFTASTPKAKKAVCPVRFYNDDEVIVGMGHTTPEYRNRGLLQAIVAEAYNYQFSLGYRKFKGIVGANNSQCLHSIQNFRANQPDAPILGKGVYTRILWFYRWKETE